ncbi:luciferin 4-monooxygenase-like [Epargyreus clarus]|uniref:luciferin 4-monooxygenase-like n=1 Tax=Epargyreus clarus TaxID=520877 RepID=UPI003C2F22D6
MPMQEYASDAVHWYLNEIASRVVAESGRPTDRFHLGKIILQSFKDAPDFILQIDGATGETETFASGHKRSVQCANAFRKIGIDIGDVIVIMAPNHIHQCVPIYATLFIGAITAGVDMTLGVAELSDTFKNILPKIIFCQNEKAKDVQQAVRNINHEALIITYDQSDDFLTFSNLLKSGNDVSVADFKASDFDTETTIALLIATSGTSGLPKSAVTTHCNWFANLPYIWSNHNNFPTPFKMHFMVSPIQWLSATAMYIFSPILRFTRLQTSAPITREHFYEVVNKYKPSYSLSSPNFYMQFYKPDALEKCDLTCFERLIIGGSFVPPSLLDDIKAISPNTHPNVAYGLSETTGMILNCVNMVPGSIGSPIGSTQYRIVNPETQEDINVPNVPGELRVKGRGVFMGYYNNPKMTEEVKTKDGWLKTGDVVYRDDRWNFFFVERLKMLMKYMNHQISPVEIERLIIKHPGVFDVAVTGIKDPERGDLPVACVVRQEGSNVTAQEIKDLVKDTLSDSKQLRGGVLFLDKLPMTPSFKVNRSKLSSMVIEMARE